MGLSQLGPPVVPFYLLGEGSPHQNRLEEKSWYPHSNLSNLEDLGRVDEFNTQDGFLETGVDVFLRGSTPAGPEKSTRVNQEPGGSTE